MISQEPARLMLLDTYGLVYRGYFALPPLLTTRGVPIGAAYGFTMMLVKLIADEKPTHVIAAFDRGMPASRVALYPEYKAHRDATPDDLRSQFALVRQILATYKIPIIEVDNEEADDVIATLALQASAQGHVVDVVTGDLDLLQVVDDRVTVLATRRGISDLARYTPDAVRERFELEPGQLPDYRGLKGDPSDNLPGIPGIGEKTAIKLIKAAGTLDALIADPKLAGTAKLTGLIETHGAAAQTYRDVSTIKRDLPIAIDWDASRFTQPGNDDLFALYRELEFKSLLAKLDAPKELPAEAPANRIEGHYENFTAITDPPDFRTLAGLIRDAATYTRSALVVRGDEVGISNTDETGFRFLRSALDLPEIREAFERYWTSVDCLVVHDVKNAIAQLGVAPRSVADDTMIGAHLLDPSRSFADLRDAVRAYLDRDLPDDDTAAYADACGRLAHVVRAELERRDQHRLYRDVEVPLATVLAKLERIGIAIDPSALGELSAHVDAAVERLQAEVYELAGETFNLGSPMQLGAILFEKLGLPGGKKNKTGWATGVEILQGLAREYPICAKVLEYREVSKLKNTYIDVLPHLADANGRIHTIFDQTTTATGRLSSTNPNLQNIPVRSDLGRQIRRAFVAPTPERVLLAADYSQIELRLMAHLSGDEAMRAAFHEGQDIHDFTARRIFDLGPLIEVSGNQRRMAKSVNFGLLYGMSDFGLAQRLEIERGEARTITQAYFARFPGVKGFIARSIEEGRERGYVATLLGRRRYMPDLASRNFALRGAAEREATNAPLQGSAADLMKLAMVRIDRALTAAGLDAQMLLQIHDELIFELAASDREAVARIVKTEMETAMELTVPLVVTLKAGSNWYEVESFDLDALDVAP
jgi:DNA polymerase-1